MIVRGADAAELERIRERGRDHGGNPVEPFTDDEGDWPLRCCLQRSRPGDRLAIIAFSPFPWESAYREVGPIVVHDAACGGVTGADVPLDLERAPKVIRVYGHDRRQLYDRNRLVEGGQGIATAVDDVFADQDVDIVHVRNLLSGCWAFEAERD